MLQSLTNALTHLPYLDDNYAMTLERFLKTCCINKHHQIRILAHDDTALYFFEGKELTFSKTAYLDPNLKSMVYIGTNDLAKIVTNWTCWDDNIIIYIKEVQPCTTK